MGPFGVPELVIILVIVVIIFGVGKLPEIGGAFGKSIKEFKTQADDTEQPTMSIDGAIGEKGSSLAAGSDSTAFRDDRTQARRQEVRADDV